jgi:putative Mg2+ transporter-C (MgtC) family protein
MLGELTIGETAARLGAAMLFGAVLGFDRERHDKPAGLRTHTMVSLGASAFTLVTLHFVQKSLSHGVPGADPIRLVDGIVGGIGFLGAGTIIQARGHVEGITTAAGIWVTGAVGLACGLGEYWVAGLTVAGAILVLEGLNIVKKRVNPQLNDKE